MSDPVFDPAFWQQRLQEGTLQNAVFTLDRGTWEACEAKHRGILAKCIKPTDSVLDAGCGYGRLLDLMPMEWYGEYLGLDISPEMISEADRRNPEKAFGVWDLRKTIDIGRPCWDWCVLLSIRPMVVRNMGQREWDRIEANLRKAAKRLLYLEMDPDDEGSVE